MDFAEGVVVNALYHFHHFPLVEENARGRSQSLLFDLQLQLVAREDIGERVKQNGLVGGFIIQFALSRKFDITISPTLEHALQDIFGHKQVDLPYALLDSLQPRTMVIVLVEVIT